MALVPTLMVPSGHWLLLASTCRISAWTRAAVLSGFMLVAAPLQAEEGSPALLTVSMSGSVIADPINEATNPKLIPGGVVEYILTITNATSASPSPDSVIIANDVPAGLKMFVADLQGQGAGPLLFAEGPAPSTLRYQFQSLASPDDAIEFSSNRGASFDYTPDPDSEGYDLRVTNFRIRLHGVMAAAQAAPTSFTMRYRMGIN